MTIVIIGLGIAIFVVFGVFLYILVKNEKEETKNNFENTKNKLTKIVEKDGKKGFFDKNIDNFVNGLKNIQILQEDFLEIKSGLEEHIIGMSHLTTSMFLALLCEGHLLIEGAPGLAKTKTVNTFSKLLGLNFQRIQFTPDMLPGDVVGVEIYNQKTQNFDIQLGPIVSNIILADEINRTTPKVQSAMLEAMQEKQITIAGKTHKLPEPFLVLATQNPIEQEGTYPLPEAQLDRFMMKILIDYPNVNEEKQILNILENQSKSLKKLITHNKLKKLQEIIKKIIISDGVKDYITDLVSKTRNSNLDIEFGASPRASINLMFASKAVAFLENRDFVTIQDIQKIFLPIMRHRIILNYDAIVDGKNADEVLLKMVS